MSATDELELNLTPARDAATKRAQFTERDLLEMLHARYKFVRPGTHARRYAVAEHVSNTGSTMGASELQRIADFLAQDTYRECLGPDGRPKQGQLRMLDGHWRTVNSGEYRQVLHGHEVKISRSDWLTELADPTKSAAWRRYCDRWWLVAPRDVVRDDLPEGWGHLAPDSRGRLRVVVHAPLLTPEPMPTRVRAQVMRSVAWTATQQALKETGR